MTSKITGTDALAAIRDQIRDRLPRPVRVEWDTGLGCSDEKIVHTQSALDRLLRSLPLCTRCTLTEEPPRPLSAREKKSRLAELRRRYTEEA